MLRIYTAAHCPACATARLRFAQLRARYPGVASELVDIDVPGTGVPPHVIGTPIYTWNDRIIFRGNPAAEELVALVAALGRVGDGPAAG